NIAFGLENLKWPKDKISARVSELLAMLKIEGYQKRYPSELSGGQQQRVAIARTLATAPKVLLMDEPLSNLDAKLRTEMRAELKRLHKETGATFVYVTHDQLEAMTLSTKVCLLNAGQLQQYEPPLFVYHDPANIFVADFVGSPTMNFIEGQGQNINLDQVKIEADGLGIIFTPFSGSVSLQQHQKVVLGIRPEYVAITDDSPVKASIYSTLPSGMETILKLQVGTHILTSVVFGSVDYQLDSKIAVRFVGDRCALFDKGTGNKLATGSIELV
ncbi:MAG: ABC transporter ATP-binding protein, partial [Candidatus Kryptoniota bacterium]